jgi:hypothetical protein
MEVLASKGTEGHTAILPESAERLVDLLWSVWQEYHPKRAVSLRQASESLGQSEVQAVKDADAGRWTDKPGKENESELVSSLERHLRDDEMLDRKSRMKREFHVRFCERPKGRFLWPTRPAMRFLSQSEIQENYRTLAKSWSYNHPAEPSSGGSA